MGGEGQPMNTFLIAMTKHPDSLNKEGVILTRSLKETVHCGGKGTAAGSEVAG